MKPIFFICFTLLALTRVAAQFTPPVVVASTRFYETGHRPYDWDGDGDLDFIGYRGLTILDWYENAGGGLLLDPVVLDTFDMNYALLGNALFADFNTDGHSDIVITTGENLLVYRQAPDGQFNQPDSLPFDGTNNARVRLADLDIDGDPDLVTIGFGMLQWHENDGTGHFAPPAYIADAPDQMLFITDVDMDGRPDIFGVNYSPADTVLLYLNPGGGIFISKEIPTLITEAIYSFTVADVDGDELPDLLPAWGNSFVPYWLKNTGNGTFSLPQLIDPSYSEWPSGYVRMSADLDIDGDPDIIIGGNDTLLWIENMENGTFSKHLLHTGLAYELTSPLAYHDFDEDGIPDLIYSVANIGIAYRKNLGGGQFAPRKPIAPEFLEIRDVQPVDLDNDGKKDLLMTSYHDQLLAWYPNLGSGQWGPQRVISTSNNNQTLALPADLDGDGDADIVSSSDPPDGDPFRNELFWYENLGAGQFGPAKMVLPGVPIFAESAKAIDMDTDGDLDLAFQLNGAELSVVWMPNDGTGHFGFPVFIDPGAVLNRLEGVTDMDKDGDPDIVVSLQNGLYWYANDGAGFFDSPFLLSASDTPWLEVGDMDGDSLPDVVYHEYQTGMVWARNPGNGAILEPPQLIMPEPVFTQVTTGYQLVELNGDGHTDVLSNFDDFSYGWIPNLGGGHFGERIVLGISRDYYNIVRADDLDGDGDKELIYGKPAELGYHSDYEGLPSVRGGCYLDENANGQRDAGEPNLPGIRITLNPSTPIVNTDQDGVFRFTAPPGQYILGFQADSCWTLTSDSAFFHVIVPSDSVFQFGFRPYLEFTNIQTFVASTPPICGQTVPFWLVLHNDGCHAAKARYRFEIGPQLSWGSAIPNPSVIVADTVFWEIDSLLQPGETRNIEAFVLISPAIAGDVPVVTGIVETISPDGLTVLRADTFDYPVPVLCSYDPNDKLVNVSELPPNYSTDSSLLIYTIRFQNTGNFMAFNIRVRDTLDTKLDWSSFEPLAASHAYFSTLDTASGVAQFDFLDIRLADSTSNEPESHGFVAFSIRLNPGLSPGSVTRNRAGIYFDVNAPIITNWAETKVRQLVSTRPTPAGPVISISPNPATDVLKVFFPNKLVADARVQVFNLRGQMVLEKQVPGGLEACTLDVSMLPAAAYLLKIDGSDGAIGQAFFVKI